VLIYHEVFFLPVVSFVLFLVWLAFTSLDKFLYLIVFLVPLSVPLSEITGDRAGFDFSLPTELMLAGLMILFFLKYLRGERPDLRILRHPLTIAVYFNLAWIFITSFSSSIPLVSFKFLISRMWFVVSFYLIAAAVFNRKSSMRKYIWMYLTSFSLVIIYVFIRHGSYGFLNQMASHFVVKPFYNDHTAYGMALGMLIPALIGLYVSYREKLSLLQKSLFVLLILLFLTAALFSYTRATWVSLAGAAGVWLIVKLRIRWQYLAAIAIITSGLFFVYQTDIVLKLERNKQISSGKITEHLQSVSNIRTDVSNLERLNRWSCAVRMFKEKPLLGWGPGTYMFQYAPFQNSWEKTSISTNTHSLGNAHSEYLGPLAEQGIPGLVSILLIVVLSLVTGFRVFYRSASRQVRVLALSVMLGLITYYIHGALNNFLDSDKASALFWGFTAILVTLDVKYVRTKQSGQ